MAKAKKFKIGFETNDINFQADNGSGGIETYFLLDGSEGVVTFPDDNRLTFGTGRDLFLYHTGTGMVMKNFTCDMFEFIFFKIQEWSN